jgi:hypothetical protein
MKKFVNKFISYIALMAIVIAMSPSSAYAAQWEQSYIHGALSSEYNNPVEKWVAYDSRGYRIKCTSISGTYDRYIEVTNPWMYMIRFTTTGEVKRVLSNSTTGKVRFIITGYSSGSCYSTGSITVYK